MRRQEGKEDEIVTLSRPDDKVETGRKEEVAMSRKKNRGKVTDTAKGEVGSLREMAKANER